MANRKALFILISISLVLAGLGGVPVAFAQEATPEPTPAPTSTPGPAVDDTAISDLTVEQWAGLLVAFVVVLVAAHFVSLLLVWILRRLVRRAKSQLAEDLLTAIRPQISWFFAALGFQIVTLQLPLDDSLKEVLNNIYYILYWFVILATAWRSINFLLKDYSDGVLSRSKNKALSQRALTLLERLSRIVLVIMGAVVLLNHFGVDMLSLAAAIGLTGFAISLAAKDTITNIISGLVIMLDHPFEIGDRIDVPNLGTWGDVTEIGLRSTKVITRDNRLIIVPNSAIVDNAIVNYSSPDPTYRLQTDIGVGTGEDVGRVVHILKDTVSQVEGVLADKSVDILFTGFGDSSNTFRVRWWVPSYADKRRVTHSVCTAIQEAATQEDINMPNPTYTLDSVVIHSDDGQVLPGSSS